MRVRPANAGGNRPASGMPEPYRIHFPFGLSAFLSYGLCRESRRTAGGPVDKILRRKGDNYCMGWRTKLVSLLIVYGAGFATAIYCLAPAPEAGPGQPLQLAGIPSAIQSQELAKSVNSGIHKCVDLGKEAAGELAKRIRQEIDKAQSEPATSRPATPDLAEGA